MSAEPRDDSHHWATVGTGAGGHYRWFDPRLATGRAWGRHLPHWRQDGCAYFVTFRRDDSISEEVLAQWQGERERWLDIHPYPHAEPTAREFHRLFTGVIQRKSSLA